MGALRETEITTALAALKGWGRKDATIVKSYSFPGFREAMAFVNRVADLAEELNHHPDILVSYDKVTLTLSSHDAGGLTERDFRLAARIDA
jgi:4a-hydroxytetrahydrobiopterin dehydratase